MNVPKRMIPHLFYEEKGKDLVLVSEKMVELDTETFLNLRR